MVRGLRDIRTMRNAWDEQRRGPCRRPSGPAVVRRFAVRSAGPRHPPREWDASVRAWVFSKQKPGRADHKRLLVERIKEPEVDVFDEEKELIVLAQLTGVAEKDVLLTVEADVLLIEAVSRGGPGQVHYYREVVLPCEVCADFDRSYRNGILQVHLRPRRQVRQKASGEGSVQEAPPTRPKRERETQGLGKR